MAYMNFAEVKKWQGTKTGERGDEYEAFKRKKAEILISYIEKKRPGFRDNIRSYTASTPLTLRDHTGTINGALYGVLKSSGDPLRTLLSPRTKLSNLYLTGQNVLLHGLLGVTITSVLTCGELLGLENIIDKVKDA